ncbi:MAG TPA: AAA family ATPase [Thermoanaerobaculia bacterium]|nr:AAA family ATPase [Thermoanaerobaculia bacterium]
MIFLKPRKGWLSPAVHIGLQSLIVSERGTAAALVERVSLRSYRSIGECDVALRPLTVIVGRNGSGKSNFLGSLHFLSDALSSSLEHAIRARGGIKAITHKRQGPPLRIEVSFRATQHSITYLLELDKGLVTREELMIRNPDGSQFARYVRSGRKLVAHTEEGRLEPVPAVLHDRLVLVALSGMPQFRGAFDLLSSMRFYRLNPESMRVLQDPDEGEVLRSDGSNIASVWRRLRTHEPELARRLTQYLNVIVPEIQSVHPFDLGTKETLHFHQRSGGRELTFAASDVSDGTLRVFGALVASRQGHGRATLVAIEEPETALHPGAIAALMDALHEASMDTQIIVTSHSPDVLDHVDMESDTLLVTDMIDANTTIAGVDFAGAEAMRRQLYTAGELLRMDQLHPLEVATQR